MNARRLFCLFILTWIVGCGKKQEGTALSSPPQPAAPAMPKPVLDLTQELETSVVCVRVLMAATLQREYPGILLQRAALTPPLAPNSSLRFIAVQIPDYDAVALREPSCALQVRRHKFDANGASYVMQYQGTLVHFDAATHAAILQYEEDFPYRLDTGLAVGKGIADVCLLQAVYNLQTQVVPPQEPVRGQPMQPLQLQLQLQQQQQQQLKLQQLQQQNFEKLLQVQDQQRQLGETYRSQRLPGRIEMSLLAATLKEGVLAVPGAGTDAQRISSAAVLSSDGRLAGFASRIQGQGWKFQPFTVPPAVEAQTLRYVVKSAFAQLVRGGTGYYRDRESYGYSVTVKGELKDPLHDFHSFKIAVQNRPSADFTPVSNPQEDQPAIQADAELIKCEASPDGTLTFEMEMAPGVTSTNHLIQVLLLRPDGKVGFHAAPFMLVSKLRGAGLHQKVLGLAGSEQAAAQAGSRELTTESRILYGLPICEGREVLFKLDGAPFWKRLSLAQGKWLPLPADNLSLACLTGNKEAIFVLQPGRREIRRYNAATMVLEKSMRLPDGITYQGLAAGCLSDDAPVAVIGDKGAVTCDPKDLSVTVNSAQKDSAIIGMWGPIYYQASGDGTQAWGRLYKKDGSASPPNFFYLDGLSGFVTGYSSGIVSPRPGRLPTVGGACVWSDGITTPDSQIVMHRFPSMRSGTAAPLASSPNIYSVNRGWRNGKGELIPPQCVFYSYYSEEPWATVDVPEAAEVLQASWDTFTDRLWFDPVSLTFALWHHDQTITLHTLEKASLPEPRTPVLLNYPDCFVQRGTAFHFKPLLLGASAQLSLSDTPSGFTQAADGTMHWPVPLTALPRQVVLGAEMVGAPKDQRPVGFKLALQLGGQQPVVAAPVSMSTESVQAAIALAGRGDAAEPLVPLTWHAYKSDRPIRNVLSGLDDCLGLMLEDRTLALLSPKDWNVVGSLRLGETAVPFMAGDAVFIYNTSVRELTRHALPDLTVTHRFQLPGTTRLVGLGVGVKHSGPLCLLLADTLVAKDADAPPPYGQQQPQQRSLLILDKQTLSPSAWAAYTPPPKKPQPSDQTPADLLSTIVQSRNRQYSAQSLAQFPVQIPTSEDGRLLVFPAGFLFISPDETVAHHYPESSQVFGFGQDRDRLVIATPTANRVFSDGLMYPGGRFPQQICDAGDVWMSRCGNYISSRIIEGSTPLIKLYAADDGRHLLNLHGMASLKLSDSAYASRDMQVMPMGEKNLLTVLSRGGRILQIIHLDLAAACRAANPGSAYVTSHPFPNLKQGQTMSYQVTVNHPAAVARYELRDNTPGATIGPQGRFTCQAPANQPGSPQELDIAIMIRFKNGESALHQFPIHVLPAK